MTPLLAAVENGNDEAMALLLEHGADPDAKDVNWGRTVLHGAALRGQLDAARTVLDHGADVDAVDSRGMTPLRYAGRYGQRDVVELLRSRGASTAGLEENYGRSPLLDREVGEALHLEDAAVEDVLFIVSLGEWEKIPRLQAKTLVGLRDYGEISQNLACCI